MCFAYSSLPNENYNNYNIIFSLYVHKKFYNIHLNNNSSSKIAELKFDTNRKEWIKFERSLIDVVEISHSQK